MFYGYCLTPVGWTPPVRLENAAQCFSYAMLQARFWEEVRVVDDEDYIVLHIKEQEQIFPGIEEGVTPEALAAANQYLRGEIS